MDKCAMCGTTGDLQAITDFLGNEGVVCAKCFDSDDSCVGCGS